MLDPFRYLSTQAHMLAPWMEWAKLLSTRVPRSPKLTRLILGCITGLVLFEFLIWTWFMSHSGSGSQDATLLDDTTVLTGKPWWTTEQTEPRFAYVQYATNVDYLCNTIINFDRLKRFGAKYDQVLIFPGIWVEGTTKGAKAIANISVTYPHIHLRPFDIVSTTHGDGTWRDSLTKLHAFALTEWTRVLAFDSDSLVLNSLDHFFLSPMAPVAVPRAYWLRPEEASIGDQVLASHVMLIEPNVHRHEKLIQEASSSGDFDMEVINHLFHDSAMVLPHRHLALLTGEFRSADHTRYLSASDEDEWNPVEEVSKSYLVHFSDWPLPKPWKHRSQKQWELALPDCPEENVEMQEAREESKPRCLDRMMWSNFYQDYETEKDALCPVVFQR